MCANYPSFTGSHFALWGVNNYTFPMSYRKPVKTCPRCHSKIQFPEDPRQAFCPECVNYLDNIEQELAEEAAAGAGVQTEFVIKKGVR